MCCVMKKRNDEENLFLAILYSSGITKIFLIHKELLSERIKKLVRSK